MTAPRLGIGIIGAGRVGAVLGAALRAEGHAIVGVSAVSDASRERAETLLPGVPILAVEEVVRRAELVVLAVPDDQLAPLAAGLAAVDVVPGGQVFLHVSGAHGIQVLAPLAERGSAVAALHPAMTFTGTAADLPRLVGCPVAITAHGSVEAVAQALVLEIGAQPVTIAEADRALYHAAMSHGANHLVVLVSQARQLLAQLGVEDPGALLRHLLTAALDESLRHGAAALTGPVRRGDAGTVSAHLEALAEADASRASHEPGDVEATYRALALAALARAGLPEGDAARVRGILARPSDAPRHDASQEEQ